MITKADVGGAQIHLLQIIEGLKDTYDFKIITGQVDFLTHALRAIGIEVFVFPALIREFSVPRDIQAYRQIVEKVKELQPELVHAHSFKAGIVARLAAKRASTPSIFTAHGWIFTPGAPLMQRLIGYAIESILVKISTGVVVVSNFDEKLLDKIPGSGKTRRHVVRNATAQIKANWEELPSASDKAVQLITVGRLTAVKNQQLLVNLMGSLPNEVTLTIIGDGPLRHFLQAEIERLGLESRVTLAGGVENVPQHLSQAQIFVLASKYEGLPLSILEAMSMGLPVVATDVGGVSEAVVNGDNGFLIDPGNTVQFTQKLNALIERPKLRRQMGQRSFLIHQRNFALDQFTERMREVYQSYISQV